MPNVFTSTKSKLQPDMKSENKLMPSSLIGNNPTSPHFWIRAGVMIWLMMKFNQMLFHFPDPLTFTEEESNLFWNEHIKGGLQWLSQLLSARLW